jgi:predicted metalloprotease with PDZ domain
VNLNRFFESAVYATDNLPLPRLLKHVGVELQLRPAESMSDRGGKAGSNPSLNASKRADLRIRTRADGNEVRITHVLDGGSAQRAGISAGDVIVAVDALRVTGSNFDKLLSQRRPGERIRLHVFRRDELLQFDIRLSAPARDTCFLSVPEDKAFEKARRAWLGAA